MTMAFIQFSPKTKHEDIFVGFDLSKRLASGLVVGETLSTASFSIAVQGGVDPAAPAMLATPTVEGNVAKVMLTGGVPGCSYEITCRVTTSGGRTLESRANISVTV